MSRVYHKVFLELSVGYVTQEQIEQLVTAVEIVAKGVEPGEGPNISVRRGHEYTQDGIIFDSETGKHYDLR